MRSRPGFTLIELLVVVSVIGILVALLIPAVQAAREASRLATCSANLKQMTIASANFEASRGNYPPGYGPVLDPRFRPADAVGQGGRANAQIQLLPYLEQSNLYNLFNFSFDLNYINNEGRVNPNFTAGTQMVSSFLCPSDGSSARAKGGLGCSNYYASLGATASQLAGPATNADGTMTYCEASTSRLGIFNVNLDPVTLAVIGGVTLASVLDGTSQTAMFSEVKRSRLVSNSSGSPDDPSYVFVLHVGDSSWDNRVWPQVCQQWDAGRPMLRIYYRGLQYYRNLPATGYYVHTLLPNASVHDCSSDGGNFGTTATLGGGPLNYFAGHIGARSYHAGGVNVAFCDGSVRFVRSQVSSAIWQALGTRSGGEIQSLD